MAKIEVTGGAYREREGLIIEVVDGFITITGWYDGGCPLDIGLNMPFTKFVEDLGEKLLDNQD
jgi:hypothetical protein